MANLKANLIKRYRFLKNPKDWEELNNEEKEKAIIYYLDFFEYYEKILIRISKAKKREFLQIATDEAFIKKFFTEILNIEIKNIYFLKQVITSVYNLIYSSELTE